MQTIPDCAICLMRQSLSTIQMATDCHETQERFVKRIARYVIDTPIGQQNPAVYTTPLYHAAAEETGIHDLFLETRKRQNDLALRVSDHVEEAVRRHEDPLHAAARIAGAGNLIDSGIGEPEDVENALIAATDKPFDRDDSNGFFLQLRDGATKLLYILDNAGEIVFDRLFMQILKENFPKLHITAVVKGGAILNDAILEDVHTIGMDTVADRIISTGTNFVGVPLELVSDEFRQALDQSDLFLSKGQANFESLDHLDGGYFLLTAKCPIVADALKSGYLRTVFAHSGSRL